MVCIIGITSSFNEGNSQHHVADPYVTAVYQAGGLPFLLPSLDPTQVEDVYAACDGFLFSGGVDVDPYYFGEEPQQGLGEIDPQRDAFEIALARLVLQGRKPALAICRGIQVVNIAAGGSIYQDITTITSLCHSQQAPRYHGSHTVEIAEDSRLYQILKNKDIRVNSFHHQAVNLVGKGLKACGWSKDGLIEAVEIQHKEQWILGVQWHPECCYAIDSSAHKLFQSFIREVKSRKER